MGIGGGVGVGVGGGHGAVWFGRGWRGKRRGTMMMMRMFAMVDLCILAWELKISFVCFFGFGFDGGCVCICYAAFLYLFTKVHIVICKVV